MMSVARNAPKWHRDPPGTTLVAIPGGLLIGGLDPDQAEEIADRLTLWIPERARAFDADRGEWVIVSPFDRTARGVVLTTCGAVRELTGSSHAEGLVRLRAATGAGRVAA